MSRRPRLLDAFCGAGGAAMGYARAGFEVVGVDLHPQKNYPFEFHQADAIHYLIEHGREFNAIHASPPCQHYSAMSACRPGLADDYPDLIPVTRRALDLLGAPYVIENVPGSTVRPDITLCGQMFGLELYRHRLFESNMYIRQTVDSSRLPHPEHRIPASKAGHWKPGTVMSVSGHVSPMWKAREVMGGIDWMNRDELAESIPPQYTEHIGGWLLSQMKRAAA